MASHQTWMVLLELNEVQAEEVILRGRTPTSVTTAGMAAMAARQVPKAERGRFMYVASTATVNVDREMP